jgi:hypothetical protein
MKTSSKEKGFQTQRCILTGAKRGILLKPLPRGIDVTWEVNTREIKY